MSVYTRKQYARAYAFLLMPALTLFCLFFLYPFFRSVWLSFTDAYGYRQDLHWIGLKNYREALGNPAFLEALMITLRYTVFTTVFANMLALFMALLADGSIRLKKALRTAFFLPNLMSLIIVGFVWVFLYGDVYRSVQSLLKIPKDFYISWLGNPSLAVYSIGITAVWQCAGYYMLIYAAALSGIPDELREAAAIDGANGR